MSLPAPAPDLVLAATYERVVHASLERVWENVLDWEHLPWLHARAFDSIEPLEAGDWGWRAKLEGGGREASIVELLADREASLYVVRSEGGASAGSEVWTHLDAQTDDATHVRVDFRVPPLDEGRLRAVGEAYVSTYTTLWDEDEEMMRERAARLGERVRPPADSDVDLGAPDALRERLPLDVVFEGRRFRVVEREGRFVAHASVCPHMLGPLFAADGDPDTLECPWHGYAFDARTGRSCDGRGLRLPAPPEVSLDAVPRRCTLVRAGD